MFQKKVSIILDGLEQGTNILERIKILFSEWQIYLVFWDREKRNFFSEKGEKKNLENLIFDDDLVINLLDRNEDKFKEIQKRLEIIKIPIFGNSLKTELLLGEKVNLRKILQIKKIKTPVFEKIADRNTEELFKNFPQPSKILKDKYIEEDIVGEDIYVFVFKNKDNQIIALANSENQKIIELASKYFRELGIESFAWMHFKVSQIRGIYLMNVIVNLKFLVGDNEEYTKTIFEKYSLENLDFLIQ